MEDMKIVCIKSNKLPISIGKEYDVYKISSEGNYYIIDDDREAFWYASRYFETKVEHRNRTISEILE